MDGKRQIRLITFRVGTELFVLDIMAVRQIAVYTGSRPIPHAPSFIEGITVLRNEVVPIIDLRSRLFPQLPAAEEQPFLLIVRSANGVLGLKVDEVRRILNVDLDSILPPSQLVRGMSSDLFVGVIPVHQDLYLVLDLDAVLTPEEQHQLGHAALDQHVESQAG